MDSNTGRSQIIDLRTVAARELEPLLADEILEWRRELDWDFQPSAKLVREYASTNSLGGAALVLDGQVAGYGYAVLEEPRGIIGDLYIRPQHRSPQHEAVLFRSLLEALSGTRQITRMESQLMLTGPVAAEAIQADAALGGKTVRLFERLLLSRDAAAPLPEERASVRDRFHIEPWDNRLLHAASAIIAGAYKGEADSEINAQYRSPSGARRFLSNIVEFPGCGNFHPDASFLAIDRVAGNAVGMVLSSFVADGIGHISQLCVIPEARGAGLGRELLRLAVASLYRSGARRISLTVTASNATAIAIYEQFGFRPVRTFFAYIWEA